MIKVRAFDGKDFWVSNTLLHFFKHPLDTITIDIENAPFSFDDLELSSRLFDSSKPKKEIYVNDVVNFLNIEKTIEQKQEVYETGFIEFNNGQFLINSKGLGHQSLYGAANVTIVGYKN